MEDFINEKGHDSVLFAHYLNHVFHKYLFKAYGKHHSQIFSFNTINTLQPGFTDSIYMISMLK